MTTTKTEKKDPEIKTKETRGKDDLRIAYEIHTLAQTLYGEMAMTNPWLTPPSPLASFEATKERSPFMAAYAGPGLSVPAQWSW